MKSIVLLLLGLGCGIAGTALYFKHQPPAPAPAAAVVAVPAPVAAPQPEPIVVAPPVVTPAAEPRPELTGLRATNPIPGEVESEAVAALRKTIDSLLKPEFHGQKQALFDRLRASGQIDDAIAELQRRAKDDPADANIQTTLGEAMLNKVRLLHESGADVNEQGILAMQADQTFNAALKIDPKNWEAQFVKYSTMYYWPANEARDADTAQKLSSLIDQQEAMPTQAHFAQTYVMLGNQYQKMGKPDFAEATWRLGLAKFPNDTVLRQKLAGR